MLRQTHKAKYTQAIPGISRVDDELNLIHGDQCFSYFGEGLPHPEKLVATATNAQQRGRQAKVTCENLNEIAESGIRDAFVNKEKKLKQWKEHLNEEIDSLAKEIDNVEDSNHDMQKWKEYFKDMMRIATMTSEYRRRIKDYSPNDRIENLGKEEIFKLNKAIDNMQQHSRELRDVQKKLADTRNDLMSEVKDKVKALNIGKQCQHSEPLPRRSPFTFSEHSSQYMSNSNSEDDWERNVEIKVQNALAMRQEAGKARCRAANAAQDDMKDTREAWQATTKAIQEAVQEDERKAYNITSLLKTIGENMIMTKQRIASLCGDTEIQERCKSTQTWRMQNMMQRPSQENIRDKPVMRLEEEMNNINKKTNFLSEEVCKNKILLQDLQDEKNRQTVELETVANKLFIERENCLGLRRTLKLEN